MIYIMNYCREENVKIYSKYYYTDSWTEPFMIEILKVQSAFNRQFDDK